MTVGWLHGMVCWVRGCGGSLDLSVYYLPLLLSLWLALASVPCMIQSVLSLQSCLAVVLQSISQFSVQFPLKNFPNCHIAALYTFPYFSLFFSVLCCALRKLVDAVCLCVCWGFQEGVGQWSWQQLCTAFQALIETYCQSDTRICMQCFSGCFFLLLFFFTGHSPLC